LNGAYATLADDEDLVAGPFSSPLRVLVPHAQIDGEIVAYTLTLYWAGKLSAFHAAQSVIVVHIQLAQDLAKCRVTQAEYSEEDRTQTQNVTQIKVEEDVEMAREMDEGTFGASNIDMEVQIRDK
jgi:hypothetical protein